MLNGIRTQANERAGEVTKPSRADRAPAFPFVIASLCVIGWVVCFALGSVVNSQPFRDYLNRATNLEVAAAESRREAPRTPQVIVSGGKKGTDGWAPVAPETPGLVVTKDDLSKTVTEAVKAQTPAEAPRQAKGDFVEQGLSDMFSIFGLLSVVMVVVSFTPPNLALLGALAAVAGAAGRWMMDGVSQAENAAKGVKPEFEASGATLRTWASTMMLSALSRGFFVYLAMLSGLLVLTGDPFDKPTPGQYVRLAGTCSLFCFIVGWQPDLLKGIIAKFITKVAPEPQVEASKTTVTKKVESTVTQTVEAKKETAPVLAEGVTPNGKDVGKGAGREKVETV